MSFPILSTDTGARESEAPAATYELLAGGTTAFERILQRIGQARRSIKIRAFEWRDDATGEMIGRALLDAADRGVQVTIYKDRVGMCYEHLEASKQSFFHKKIGLVPRLQTWFLMVVYGRWGSLRQRPSSLADALLAHRNVTVHCDRKRFDHAKLYVFDGETVILGGMGIGDDFRCTNVDFMVEISGQEAIARLTERYQGDALFDADRPYDFLLHSFQGNGRTGESLADARLGLIAGTRRRLTIAMAYLGDRDCTEALVAAVKRGVFVTLLTAERANIIADLNLATCAELLRRTGSPENLRVVLHPRMVHGKAIVGDSEWVDIGSTNFTSASHGGYEEVDLFCRDADFAKAVEESIERDLRDGVPARLPVKYRPSFVAVERFLSSVHGREKNPKPHRSP